MFANVENAGKGTGSRRQRSRLRGLTTSKTGKTIGIASIAAPIIGYIVSDLRKPDSIIHALINEISKKLLSAKWKKIEAIDITDKVEVITDDNKKGV